jgi:hypothetical protein
MTEPCPPAEDLGALVDGEVSGASRERLMAHLNACEECFQTFTVAVEFLEAHPEFARARPRKRILALIGVAAAAALAAALLLRGCPGEERRESGELEFPSRPVGGKGMIPSGG